MKQDIDRIAAGLTKLLGEIEGILDTTIDDADRKVDRATHQGRETLRRICGHLRQARSEVVGGARAVDGAVHSHPWGALAATAIVSFLAGLLVRRR